MKLSTLINEALRARELYGEDIDVLIELPGDEQEVVKCEAVECPTLPGKPVIFFVSSKDE